MRSLTFVSADVKHVIDSGQSRQLIHDQLTRSTQLKTGWISKQSLKQRAGRGGRVSDGHYHALFTRARRDSMAEADTPDILRSDLQPVCLDIKAEHGVVETSLQEYFQDFLSPPSPLAVSGSIVDLIDSGILTEDEDLTDLGRLLSFLPVHPRNGKLVL